MEQGTWAERAMLNEARELSHLVGFAAEQVERLCSRLSFGEHKTKQLFKSFDKMIDALERNASSPTSVDLGELLVEAGMAGGEAKPNRVLEVIRECGVTGIIDSVGASRAKLSLDRYKALRRRLKNNGSVVDSGYKRPSSKGGHQIVWIASEFIGELRELERQRDIQSGVIA